MEQYFGATFRRKEPGGLPSVIAPVETTPAPAPPTPPVPSFDDWTTPRVSVTLTPRRHQLRPRREVARPYPGRLRTAMTAVGDAGGDTSSGNTLHMHSKRQRSGGPRERKGKIPSDAA